MVKSKLKPKTKLKKNIAIIGAGMAGIACARTLAQAGHCITLFEQSAQVGGRMTTRNTIFGSFDHGVQYFTVRDPRFAKALKTVPNLCKPWSASTVQVLDEIGRVAAAGLPNRDPHWVPTPDMNALLSTWAAPLSDPHQVILNNKVIHLDRDVLNTQQWQLRTQEADGAQHVFSGFDAVLLATTAESARLLLNTAPQADPLAQQLDRVQVTPCWTLMLAFPQAMQPGMSSLGPHWNAARSTHHRIAWLARESSKPGRSGIERWTVQASAAWSHEHLEDDASRIQAKLLRAFSEVTGIRAEPSHVETKIWRSAKTSQPLGTSHLWDNSTGLGVCGDWCLGHRVENAFISGLELALSVA